MLIKCLKKIEEKEFYDVSEKQKQTWYNQTRENIVEILDFSILFQKFDPQKFNQVYELILNRHESLRSYFPRITNKVKQKIVKVGDELLRPQEVKIGNKNNIDKIKGQIKSQVYEEMLDLENPPLIKTFLLKFDQEDTVVFLFFIHHIIADGWSIQLLKNEFTTLYNSHSQSLLIPSNPLNIQLKDFIHWQNIRLSNSRKEKRIVYWNNKLKDANQLIDPYSLYKYYKIEKKKLIKPPYAKVKLTHIELKDILIKETKGGSCCINLNVKNALRELSSKSKTGPFSVLLTSFYLLFFKIFNEKDLIFNCPINNRQSYFVRNIVGDLTGSIYIRASISKEILLYDFIKIIFLEHLKSSRHVIYNHFPYEKRNDLNFHTNCAALVNFYEINEILGEELNTISRHLKHPCYFNQLSCSIIKYNDCFSFKWVYNLALYKPEVIQFLVEKHAIILEEMLNSNDETLGIVLDRI